jgi:hypothetical protein
MPGTYTGDGNWDLDFSGGLPERQTHGVWRLCRSKCHHFALLIFNIFNCRGKTFFGPWVFILPWRVQCLAILFGAINSDKVVDFGRFIWYECSS